VNDHLPSFSSGLLLSFTFFTQETSEDVLSSGSPASERVEEQLKSYQLQKGKFIRVGSIVDTFKVPGRYLEGTYLIPN
jgi:hypothetical protein